MKRAVEVHDDRRGAADRARRVRLRDRLAHRLVLEALREVGAFEARLRRGDRRGIATGRGRMATHRLGEEREVLIVGRALQILSERAAEKAVKVESVLADLEQHEFFITENSYDLIVVCNYLQRDLFPAIRSGVRGDGLVIAIIAMVDDNPDVKPMNPVYLVRPGELRMEFGGWTFLHDQEGSVSSDCHRRKTAQLVAQRPLENEMHNG